MTRINAAIGRIEEAIARRAQDNAALQERHEALRGEVAQTIAAIDLLVAKDDG